MRSATPGSSPKSLHLVIAFDRIETSINTDNSGSRGRRHALCRALQLVDPADDAARIAQTAIPPGDLGSGQRGRTAHADLFLELLIVCSQQTARAQLAGGGRKTSSSDRGDERAH